jgi:hypothetical protein
MVPHLPFPSSFSCLPILLFFLQPLPQLSPVQHSKEVILFGPHEYFSEANSLMRIWTRLFEDLGGDRGGIVGSKRTKGL